MSKDYCCKKLRVDEFDWEMWFTQNFMKKLLPRKVKDFNWKLFHGLVNTETRLRQMKYSDGMCKICSTQCTEDIQYLLFACGENKTIWKIIDKIILGSFGRAINVNINEAISG